MYPVLLDIGGFKVFASVTFLALGILAGLIAGRVESRRVGIRRRDFYLFAVSVIPITLLLATVNSLIYDIGLSNGVQNIEVKPFSGFVSFGAVLGALGLGYVLAKAAKKPAAPGVDVISVTFALTMGMYRIGCLLNGCCYGLETDGLLGMYLPGGGGVWAYRYPTQIMLMLLDFSLFGWLWWRRKRKSFHGELTLSYLGLFSAGRVLIDAFRDLPRVLGPLSLHQLTAIAILLGTGGVSVAMWRARRASLPKVETL